MAISRSIIDFDLFFKAKDYTEIYRMLVTNYKAIYGSDINLAINTADGEFIRTLAVILYDFSELASDTYNSVNINNAKGKLLDNLVLLSGNLIRRENARTVLRATMAFDGDPISYSENDIIVAEDIEGGYWDVEPTENSSSILGAGTLVTMTSQNVGEFFIPNESFPIREITKNANFVSVDEITLTNIILDIRGSVAETDAHLRARKRESLSFDSTSLIDSIKSEILNNIFSIDDVKIYSSTNNGGLEIPLWNGTSSSNITIPNHDVFVLVKPQENVPVNQSEPTSRAIVDVLKRKITLGISTMRDSIKVEAVSNIIIGKKYRIESLGDTNDSTWNQIFDTIDVTYSVGFVGIAATVGSGTGTVSDGEYTKEVIELERGFSETYRYYVSQPYNPFIQINITAFDGYVEDATLIRVQEALYRLAKDYPINKNINKSELFLVASNAGNLDILNPTFRINSIDISLDSTITSGANDVIVNNGYFYVDGLKDVKITLEDEVEV